MIVYGQLKDREASEAITGQLLAQGIEAGFVTSPEKSSDRSDVFMLFVKQEKDLQVALEIYRVHLGFPPKFDMPQEWQMIKKIPLGQITLFLLTFAVGIFIVSFVFSKHANAIYDLLFISSPNHNKELYYEMKNGELWRAITPIFLHFGFLHILFNSLWLKDLGSAIEFEEGKLTFLSIVLISALLSNNIQYLIIGPSFGGLSGVVFALLGHVWIKKIFYKESKIALPKHDVIFMIVWFVICMTGLFGPIANMAHAVGLSVGMITGIFSGLKLSRNQVNLPFDKKFIIKILITLLGAIFMTVMAFVVEWAKASYFGKQLFYQKFF